MKYIKKFNENNISSYDIRVFIEELLVEMFDKEYKFYLTRNSDSILIDIYSLDHYELSWLRIKDNFIPFLDILNEEYRILKQSIDNINSDILIYGDFYNIQDVLNDNIQDDTICPRIKIKISNSN